MYNVTKIAGLAAAALLALTAAGTAADLRRAPAPAPIAVAPPPPPLALAYNWSGVYFGINGGWGWGNADWVYTAGPLSAGHRADHDTDGGLVGGTVGVNWQSGNWVGGLEADIDWANIKGSTACPNVLFTCSSQINWLGTGRLRLGVAAGNFLLFGTGGVAFGGVEAATAGPASGSETTTDVGWTAGAGVEAALAGNVSLKAEWLYYDLGKSNHALDGSERADVTETGNLFRLGLNWRM
ncbi:MAG: outer membrane beta-barrel protein [Bauldia sp.]